MIVKWAWNLKTKQEAYVVVSPAGYIVHLPDRTRKYTKSYDQAVRYVDDFFYDRVLYKEKTM